MYVYGNEGKNQNSMNERSRGWKGTRHLHRPKRVLRGRDVLLVGGLIVILVVNAWLDISNDERASTDQSSVESLKKKQTLSRKGISINGTDKVLKKDQKVLKRTADQENEHLATNKLKKLSFPHYQDLFKLRNQAPTIEPVLSTGNCKIHILDASKYLAPLVDIPKCNISSAWPFNQNKYQKSLGIKGYFPKHWADYYAFGYWVKEAIRKSAVYTSDIDKADLVFLDTHCYWTAYSSLKYMADIQNNSFDPFNELSTSLSKLFIHAKGVFKMKSWRRSSGRRYVISRPEYFHPPGVLMDTCGKLKRSFLLTSERGIFCGNDRDRAGKGDSIIAPQVMVPGFEIIVAPRKSNSRSNKIYYRGFCPPSVEDLQTDDLHKLDHSKFQAQWLIRSMLEEFGAIDNLNISVHAECFQKFNPFIFDDNAVRIMKDATFCLILPAEDHQSTPSLSAAILAGCIPVFIGPPFHALPFASDVDYSRLSLFFSLEMDDRKEFFSSLAQRDEDDPRPFAPPIPGDLENGAVPKDLILKAANFRSIAEYLAAMPKELVKEIQSHVEKEKWKFYYPLVKSDRIQKDGIKLPESIKNQANISLASNIIIGRMCDYANRINIQIAENEALKKQGINPHGGFFMPQLSK